MGPQASHFTSLSPISSSLKWELCSTHTHAHRCMHTHVHTHACGCMHTHIYTQHLHTHSHVHMGAYAHAHTHVHASSASQISWQEASEIMDMTHGGVVWPTLINSHLVLFFFQILTQSLFTRNHYIKERRKQPSTAHLLCTQYWARPILHSNSLFLLTST